MKFAAATNRAVSGRRNGGFTLAEVLAALMFMAIVIPVAASALRLASLSGEVATRKGEAARIADKVLNEAIATGNWGQTLQRGTTIQNDREFRWTLRNDLWTEDSMQSLTAEVTFSAQGKDYSVRLSTLAPPQL